jgi:DeoR/GlpR family transcriptional regulator of sugar metabolism
MLNERQHSILKMLNSDVQIPVSNLAEKLGVSSVTIRQDLNFLENEGLLKRVHGGAILKDGDDLANRLGVNFERKLRIAREVATLIQDGETILIESGSVNVLLAREVLKIRNATIITTNVFIARQFRKEKNANIIILGGIYQNESETLVGKITKACIDQIHFDKAFIGIDGYESEAGFMCRDLLRAEISSHIIQRAKDVFVVSDSAKFGKKELTNIGYLSDIQHIATDDDLGPEFQKEIKNAGVDLILA